MSKCLKFIGRKTFKLSCVYRGLKEQSVCVSGERGGGAGGQGNGREEGSVGQLVRAKTKKHIKLNLILMETLYCKAVNIRNRQVMYLV